MNIRLFQRRFQCFRTIDKIIHENKNYYGNHPNVKGKKDPLNYEEFYINTPFDWLDKIEYAEKLGEELIDKRKTFRLSTDNAGIVWIDTFFGVPLQVEYEDNKYQFTKMTFNDVKDENLIPS